MLVTLSSFKRERNALVKMRAYANGRKKRVGEQKAERVEGWGLVSDKPGLSQRQKASCMQGGAHCLWQEMVFHPWETVFTCGVAALTVRIHRALTTAQLRMGLAEIN